MTFSDMQARVGQGVLRDDLASNYGQYINEALREIQNRYSFACMKTSANPLTLPAGETETSTTISSNFKELQKQPAVYFVTDDGGLMPGEVVFESQQLARVFIFWGTPIITWPPRVFFEKTNSTTAVLGMVEPRIEDFHFRVDYYQYFPALANPTDTSPLIDAYPGLVLAKAKAIAFTDINDEEAFTFNENLFEKKLKEAMRAEAYAEVRGRQTHM